MTLARTPEFDEALRLMHEGGPFTFITGRAGTGKSTLLKHFRGSTKLIVPVLAPTGVAALNVEGETIHRFFRFGPGITPQQARKNGGRGIEASTYRKADVLIIDEISMVRADLLDCIDQFLRGARKSKEPFGGLRIVAIGDLYQLPPVLTNDEREEFSRTYDSPYFFDAHVMKRLLGIDAVSFIELEKVYRQSDQAFVSLLNAVRDKTATIADLAHLNQCVRPTPREGAIVLTSINAAADSLNQRKLTGIEKTPWIFRGKIGGDFPTRDLPTDLELQLKLGARVMCIANDKEGKYVNGSLGQVVNVKHVEVEEKEEGSDEGEKKPTIVVRLDEGKEVEVTPHTWTLFRSVYDSDAGALEQEKIGSFTQMPLRLAWAVTIHKSQGKTFDQVTIDLGTGAFAPGQTYVALSRCRSFEGLSLLRPIGMRDIQVDDAIVKFMHLLRHPEEREEPQLVDEDAAEARQRRLFG